MGFFHNAFVHRGTRCYAALRALDGQGVAVAGEVTWCRFLSGTTHEIGIRSDEEIDVARFIEADVMNAA